MQSISKMVLLAVACTAFVGGITGSILFFPSEGNDCMQARGASQSISWQNSFEAGSALAKQEHKYVLADVYTDWCGWCQRLDKDVFTKKQLVNYLQKDFVCIKVNAEDPAEGTTVADTYKVSGYPCALVFSPDGKYVGRISGYEEADDYMHTLQDILAGKGEN
jgi:thiol:disulfide interchange protein